MGLNEAAEMSEEETTTLKSAKLFNILLVLWSSLVMVILNYFVEGRGEGEGVEHRNPRWRIKNVPSEF